MISTNLVVPFGNRAEELVNETWEIFCAYIDIDSDAEYENLGEAFGASSNPPLSEDDDE
jgi:hypothetical protein